MKVLVISQYYPPENVSIPQTVAAELSNRGHDVTVLTGFPNYPAGKIFDGYRQKWRSREHVAGVEIVRVPLFPSHSTNAIGRLVNYASFALSSSTTFKLAKEFDVIYVYATQMTPALGPWLWRRLGRAPYVLHIQDLWPDSILGSSMIAPGRLSALIEAVLTPWLSSVYRRASSVIGIAPTMLQTLGERGVKTEKLKMIYNWSDDETRLPQQAEQRAENRAPVRLLFAGNVGDMQDLETTIRALASFAPHELHLTVVGDGVALPKAKKLVGELKLSNVSFKGRVPKEAMAEFYAEADFALVTLKDLPAFRGTIPSKFQAAIARGVPVITNVPGDLSQLVNHFNVGLTATVENIESLRETFERAIVMKSDELTRMGQVSAAVYNERFSTNHGIDQLEEILASACARTKNESEK